MLAGALKRSFSAASLDYLGARYVGAGHEICSYTSQPVRIPMRDGVHLAADFYAPEIPAGKNPAGLILIQCCYGRGSGISFINARIYAARGYQALFVSTRGTYGSEGVFDSGRSEHLDSQDIVIWMRQQPWYRGSFATLGASYLGYCQWALFNDPPEDCVAAVIPVAPHDQALHAWGTGSFRLDRASWSDEMSRRQDEKGSFLERLANMPGFSFLRSPELDNALARLPLEKSLRTYFGNRAPWLFEYLKHSDINDEYWTPCRHHAALDRVKMPILLISGWYDSFTEQTLHQFKHLKQRNVNVNLIVGPWTHVQASGLFSVPDILDFLAENVAKTGSYKHPAAKIYVTGAEEWRAMSDWPPKSQPKTFYLQDRKSLGLVSPAENATPASFIFNPLEPTPSLGGNQMAAGGRVDDSELADRSDVSVFTSEPLKEDLEILGAPTVHLMHTSDPPIADLFLRLCEVDTRGVSHNVTEMYQALQPSRETGKSLLLTFRDCAHRFKKGTRVRLLVAGGSFPLYARSLGTSNDRVRGENTVPQKHTVIVADGVSRLVLPECQMSGNVA
ncbi:hypothetical protein N7539_004903 [Penicillium diatomitis]|uniref:Xaa-Pro dipeptidyl-peptidase C-terminal domain-containing protein n=1 Tax=Penicillium diatomitis TaxID=2819901 RepID=A0A9W9X757_9EURO|nr:uncharacterized protein N7539_004903 [Penicillium diatomitis]KAJ5484915.1 hypothetical protein N7539_004903 [Penicillium diatomitis]